MKRRSAFIAMATSAVLLVLAAAPDNSAAQGNKSIAGAYTAVSSGTKDASGKMDDTYGANPRGMLILTRDGRYSLHLVRNDLQKFASGSRVKGTPEENAAVVNGSISHFGTYTVGDGGKMLSFKIEGSSYPNWTGTTQQRPFTLKGDLLTYQVPAASRGGSGEVVWKRIK